MKSPGQVVTFDREQDVVDAVMKWSEDFIERPHAIFGGLPICPFARAARLKETIRFEVRSFAMDDPLDGDSDLVLLVREFTEQTKSSGLETLFVIHPDRAQRLQDLEAFVQRLIATLTSFARRERIGAAHFTAIGAFSEVMLGYFDRERREYSRIPVREQVEVLTLAGDIALEKGDPKVHAHVVVGKADGSAHGGHVLSARVWPTLELVLTESPRALAKRSDPETGRAVIDIGARRESVGG